MIEERLILQTRVESLRQELAWAESTFNNTRIAPILRTRVSTHFENLFLQRRGELDSLRKRSDAAPLATCWQDLRRIHTDCKPLFGECLALLQGALGREAKLDSGLCAIADALLDYLSDRANIPWGRFTILGEAESFTNLAAIIRLRFPDLDIWNLPVLGHEFGHFVAHELRATRHDWTYRYPFQELVRKEARVTPQEGGYLHERFADLFAVYTLGPAPVYASVLLRFDPTEGADEYHPSDAERMYLMCRSLALIDEGTGAAPRYTHAVTELKDTWECICEACGAQAEPVPEKAVELDRLNTEMYRQLTTLLGGARYEGWWRAQQLAEELEPQKIGLPTVPPDTNLPDVLNACWMCRATQRKGDPRDVDLIADKAVRVCYEIMNRR